MLHFDFRRSDWSSQTMMQMILGAVHCNIKLPNVLGCFSNRAEYICIVLSHSRESNFITFGTNVLLDLKVNWLTDKYLIRCNYILDRNQTKLEFDWLVDAYRQLYLTFKRYFIDKYLYSRPILVQYMFICRLFYPGRFTITQWKTYTHRCQHYQKWSWRCFHERTCQLSCNTKPPTSSSPPYPGVHLVRYVIPFHGINTLSIVLMPVIQYPPLCVIFVLKQAQLQTKLYKLTDHRQQTENRPKGDKEKWYQEMRRDVGGVCVFMLDIDEGNGDEA